MTIKAIRDGLYGDDLCAILVEIKDFKVKSQYKDAKYLLQVWERTRGKIYQIVLKHEPIGWEICSQFFYMKLDPKDDNGEFWFYEVFLGDPVRVSKIKDYQQNLDSKYFSCSGNWLYYASPSEINVIQANQQVAQHGLDFTKFKSLDVPYGYSKIPDLWVFHGFLCGKALIEDAENKLYFCDMTFDTTKKPYPINFMDKSMATVRSDQADPIVKIETYSRDLTSLHALVLRQSKTVDFYFNGIRLFCSRISVPDLQFEDVGITSEKIYLRTNKEETYKIVYEGKRYLSFDQAKIDNKIDIGNWNRILHERIRHERIELFFDFKLNNDKLYVTYDRFTSSFDLMDKIFKCETSLISQESQYLLGVNKDGDTVGLFQEASDPNQAKISQSKIFTMNSKKGLVSNQSLQGRIVSKAEFNHYVHSNDNGQMKLQHSSYFITYEKGKQGQLLCLMPGVDMTPVNIGSKVSYLGNAKESLVNYYHEQKHYKDSSSYFGVLNKSKKELTIYKHSDTSKFQSAIKLKLELMEDESVQTLHTVVAPSFSNDYLILITDTQIFLYNRHTYHVENKYTSYNLLPYNIQIVNSKYMYFQSLQGLCMINLRAAVTLPLETPCQEILIEKTLNSTNQIQFDPTSDRILYFSDFETVVMAPLPHKNAVVPYGYNRLTGLVMGEKVDVCFVTKAPGDEELEVNGSEMYKRLVGITESKNMISWEYPTCQFIEKLDHHILDNILTSSDKFFTQTSIHSKEYGKRHLLFYNTDKLEEVKGAEVIRGSPHQFKIIKFADSSTPELVKSFTLSMMPQDYLHFDSELNFMLHVQIDHGFCRQATFFTLTRDQVEDKQCIPRFLSHINKFPWEYYQRCPQANYLFSPNLVRYLAFDIKLQEFVVVKIDRGTKSRNSKVVLDGLFNQEDGDFDPAHVVNNFKWETDNSFRIINKDGFEKYITVKNGNWSIKDSTFVPMKNLLHTNLNSLYYFEHMQNKIRTNLERQLRKYQRIFTNRQLSITSKRAVQESEYVLLPSKKQFYVQQNYSIFQFKLGKALIQNNQGQIAQRLDQEDLKLLLSSIFPGNNLFLHKAFATRSREDLGIDEENVRHFRAATLHTIFRKLYENEHQKQLFHFPFITNNQNETPFDLCIPNNLKSADLLLRYLKFQPAGSNSEFVLLSLPKLIAYGLPNLPDYLDSRITQTSTHKKMNTMQGFTPIENKDYMLESSHLSPDYLLFQQKFKHKRSKKVCWKEVPLQKDELLQEKEVKVEVLDIPFLHSYNGEGFNHATALFRELSETQNLKIFSSQTVQYLIDYNWDQIKSYTIGFLFIPFVLFQGIFIAYSNVYNGQFDNPDPSFEIGYITLSALLYFFSLYFLVNEFGQLAQVKTAYFGWGFIWNAIDLFPPIFIIAVVTSRLRQDYEFDQLMQPGFIDTVHAVTCLLMWLKFLYFLRLFESTSHLVRVVLNMVWEMKTFIAILFIMYMAFGEAFLRLAEKGTILQGERPFLNDFAEAFVYCVRLGVGDTDVIGMYDVNQPITAWVLFVIFEVLTCILMMSLLVTLILKQYDRISKDAELSNYQQKAKLIFENSYLTQMCRICRTSNFEMERNLLIITDLTNQGLNISNDSQKDPIDVMQENIRHLMKENAELKQIIEKQGRENSEKFEMIVKTLKI